MPREHLVEDDPDGPDIAFVAVQIIVQGLQGHIHRRANIIIAILLEIAAADGESEISDLGSDVGEEDIGGLEVAVDDAVAIDLLIAIDDLREDIERLLLGDGPTLLDEFAEVSAVAELGDDAGVGLERDDFVEPDDVLEVVEHSQDVDFVGEKSLMHLALDVLHIDQLHRDRLTWVH